MMFRRWLTAIAVAGLGALTLAGCSSSSSNDQSTANGLNDRVSQTGSKYEGIGETTPLPRPSFTLTDTSSASFSFSAQTSGHPTLLYFGYTECPDVCPATMADIGNALRSVPAALQKKTEVVFVTTDVKHDTAAVMSSWLRHFDDGLPNQFIGLTGTQAQIDAAQAAAHVTLAEDGGQTHAASVFLYGTDDYAHVSFAQGTDLAGQIAHDLKV